MRAHNLNCKYSLHDPYFVPEPSPRLNRVGSGDIAFSPRTIVSPRAPSRLIASPRLVRTPAIGIDMPPRSAAAATLDIDIVHSPQSLSFGDASSLPLTANADDDAIFELTLTSPTGSSSNRSSVSSPRLPLRLDDGSVTGRLAAQLSQRRSTINYPPLRAGDDDSDDASDSTAGGGSLRSLRSLELPEGVASHAAASLELSGGSAEAAVLGTSPLYIGQPVISTATQLLLHSASALASPPVARRNVVVVVDNDNDKDDSSSNVAAVDTSATAVVDTSSSTIHSNNDNDNDNNNNDNDDDNNDNIAKQTKKPKPSLQRTSSIPSHLTNTKVRCPPSPSISLRSALPPGSPENRYIYSMIGFN
jgi:hypothetical protein